MRHKREYFSRKFVTVWAWSWTGKTEEKPTFFKAAKFNWQHLSEINPQTFENVVMSWNVEWQNCIDQKHKILGGNFVAKLSRLLDQFTDYIIDSFADI